MRFIKLQVSGMGGKIRIGFRKWSPDFGSYGVLGSQPSDVWMPSFFRPLMDALILVESGRYGWLLGSSNCHAGDSSVGA